MGDLELEDSNMSIGHTRWATHGGVTKTNAHPHMSENNRIVVVHNGIIENYYELKLFLEEKGMEFHGTHHEIYVSDPSRVAEEKLKTILRMPVRRTVG